MRVDSLVFVREIYALTVPSCIQAGTPDAFAFLASCLLFRPLSSRNALAGLRRVFSRARILESRATDELGDPELEGSLPGRGDSEVLFSSSFLEIRFAAVARRRVCCDRLDLSFFSLRGSVSALLMLPLSPDSLALRAAIGLIDPLGLALLGSCFPLPLSLRGTTTRAFSGYLAVLGTRSLHIPVISGVLFFGTSSFFAGGME